MDIKERYNPIVLGVNGTAVIHSEQIGGFLCQTSGTITINRGATAVPLLTAFPVTAGIYYPMPFYTAVNPSVVILAGGASGVLGV